MVDHAQLTKFDFAVLVASKDVRICIIDGSPYFMPMLCTIHTDTQPSTRIPACIPILHRAQIPL